MPDPLGGIGDIVAHLDEPGLVPVFHDAAAGGLRPARDELVVCRPPQRAHFHVQPRRACQGLGPARLPDRLVRRQHARRVPHAAGVCEASGEELRPFPSWPGLVPMAGHVLRYYAWTAMKTWMPGARPGMTLSWWQRTAHKS